MCTHPLSYLVFVQINSKNRTALAVPIDAAATFGPVTELALVVERAFVVAFVVTVRVHGGW